MSSNQIAGTVAIVTGASRGFGRAIATALVRAQVKVVGVARDGQALEKLRADLGEGFIPVAGDAADPDLAGGLLAEYRPGTLVLNAGATPVTRPIQEHTWDTFRATWEVDVQQAFHWVRAALLLPLAPGSTVLSFSSGAAVAGSPLSGGYSGAKATVRFISAYAGGESERGGLGIRFVSLLPMLTAQTDLGAVGVAAYAARQGVDVPTFLSGMGPALTPAKVGEEVLGLAGDPSQTHPAYRLTAAGLSPV